MKCMKVKRVTISQDPSLSKYYFKSQLFASKIRLNLKKIIARREVNKDKEPGMDGIIFTSYLLVL